MSYWATNIVRLPLKPGAHQTIDKQIKEFPAEFLLFVKHVGRLVLQTDQEDTARVVTLIHEDDRWMLDDAGNRTRWMVERRLHKLSPDARNDRRSLDDAVEVPLSWAAPVDSLNEPGKFWAFFPTMTTSLLAGILNAPWKTNEDRQNLLPGVYNDELIDKAAAMVANALPRLSTPEDPARHLDALPRRHEFGDNDHSDRLRDQLNSLLQGREVAPDQDGVLRKLLKVRYPPRELTTASLERWVAHDRRPSDWLHHSALTRNRVATLERLMPPREIRRANGALEIHSPSLPRAKVSKWLEALVNNASNEEEALEASMAAIQAAALIPKHQMEGNNLGNIVLTGDGSWVRPDSDTVFLGDGCGPGAGALVHPQLEADTETLSALKGLGIRPMSAETVFRNVAGDLLRHRYGDAQSETQIDEAWSEFWRLARDIDPQVAVKVIQGFKDFRDNWRGYLCVRTIAGGWRSLFNTLLPGSIIPSDGSRDGNVAIDTRFHREDVPLLQQLGAVDAPRDGQELSQSMKSKFTAPRRVKVHSTRSTTESTAG